MLLRKRMIKERGRGIARRSSPTQYDRAHCVEPGSAALEEWYAVWRKTKYCRDLDA
jgi:hypothetical protein